MTNQQGVIWGTEGPSEERLDKWDLCGTVEKDLQYLKNMTELTWQVGPQTSLKPNLLLVM
jgi:hypothetical protein